MLSKLVEVVTLNVSSAGVWNMFYFIVWMSASPRGSPFSRARVYFAGIAKIKDHSQSTTLYNLVPSLFKWNENLKSDLVTYLNDPPLDVDLLGCNLRMVWP